MALGLLDTITVSLGDLVVVGMAVTFRLASLPLLHTKHPASKTKPSHILLRLGHGDVVRVLRIAAAAAPATGALAHRLDCGKLQTLVAEELCSSNPRQIPRRDPRPSQPV